MHLMRFKFTVFTHVRIVFAPPSGGFFLPQAIGCISDVNLVHLINDLLHDCSPFAAIRLHMTLRP